MHLHEGIRYNKFLKSLTCISELVIVLFIVSANHKLRRYFILIVSLCDRLTTKCGGSDPTVWR